jgi:hypothetical protein
VTAIDSKRGGLTTWSVFCFPSYYRRIPFSCTCAASFIVILLLSEQSSPKLYFQQYTSTLVSPNVLPCPRSIALLSTSQPCTTSLAVGSKNLWDKNLLPPLSSLMRNGRGSLRSAWKVWSEYVRDEMRTARIAFAISETHFCSRADESSRFADVRLSNHVTLVLAPLGIDINGTPYLNLSSCSHSICLSIHKLLVLHRYLFTNIARASQLANCSRRSTRVPPSPPETVPQRFDQPFHFLDLPAELRCMVYENLDAETRFYTIKILDHPKSSEPCTVSIAIKSFSSYILTTCRLIHDEAL